MSKGEIIKHTGEGLYRVRQKLATDRVQQEYEWVSERLAELAVQLPEKKLALINAEGEADEKAREINLIIPDLKAGVEGARDSIKALQVDLARLQVQADALRLEVARLISEDLANRKRQNQLEQVPESKELTVWCADYSLHLSGEVGLIDVNDEGGQGALIQPGFDDTAAYDPGRDGALFPDIAQSGAQIYFNAAILPGVQKWKPRYRLGVITKLSGDACDVDLEPAKSSAQGLDINASESLRQVPIKYMDCNGFAFEEGDSVMVRFTKNGPLVVGFSESPRGCGMPRILALPTLSTGEYWAGEYYGPRFKDDDGLAINPPLGEAGSDLPAWAFSLGGGRLASYTRGRPVNYGLRNWVGAKEPDILSWHGPSSRICWLLRASLAEMNPMFPPFGSVVYYKSRVIFDLSKIPIGSTYKSVDGAAIAYMGDEGTRYLRVCASNAADHYPSRWLSTPYSIAIIDIPWEGEVPDAGRARVLRTYTHYIAAAPVTGMYFSPSGEQATMCLSRRNHDLYKIRVEVSRNGSTRLSNYFIEGDSHRTGSGTESQEVSGYWTRTFQKSGTIEERETILGFEYVGETETPIKVIYAPHRESIFSSVTTSVREFPDGAPGSWTPSSSGQVDNSATRGPIKIVFGNKLLIKTKTGMDWSETKTHSYSSRLIPSYNESGDVSYSPSGSGYSEGREARYFEYIEQGMVIDARYGFIAATIVSLDSTSTTTSSTKSSKFSYYMAGSTRSEYRNTESASLVVCMDGSELGRVTVNEIKEATGTRDTFSAIYPNPSSDGSYTKNYVPSYGQGMREVYFPVVNRPSTKRFYQGSFASADGAYLAGFEWQYRFYWVSSNESEVRRLVVSSNTRSPVSEFMKRSTGGKYLLTNVGLV